MNEQSEEFYVLQEQHAIRELVSASAPQGCLVWVGGRACGHPEDVHEDGLCEQCLDEGRPKSNRSGPLSEWYSGYDHAFMPRGPRRPVLSAPDEERAAA